MKTLKVTTLLAAFVGLTLAAPAMAQREKTGISVEVGGNYIMDGDTRDAIGDYGLRVAVGYDLPSQSLLGRETGGRSRITLSYTSGDDTFTEVDDGLLYTLTPKLTSWGLTYEERVPFRMVEEGATSPYWGVGLGVFYHKGELGASVTDGETTLRDSMDDTATRIGGRAIVGVNFANRWFVEASYNLSGKINVDLPLDEETIMRLPFETNSLALVVGARF